MPISIVLLDDHPLVLNGLEQLLQSGTDFEVLATCGTAADGLHAVEALQPDVLVLDLKLLDAARLGARGIVLKAMAPRILEECIRTVHGGGYRLSVDGVDLSKRLAE